MANSYYTPGVYVEEIPKFPPSVAGVATAIPAFIGYTEITPDEDGIVPRRITSLLEYEALFGKGPKLFVKDNIEGDDDDKDKDVDDDKDKDVDDDKDKDIDVDDDGGDIFCEVEEVSVIENIDYVLYDSIRLFYDNGGGVCYIASVGQYGEELKIDSFKDGIAALEKVDEVTLVLFPDAVNIKDDPSESGVSLGTVQTAALKHCLKMGDRFAILDVKKEEGKSIRENIEVFRDKISGDALELRYGAAYYPYLSTVYKKSWTFKDVYNYLNGFEDALELMEGKVKKSLETILSDIDRDTWLTAGNNTEINGVSLTEKEEASCKDNEAKEELLAKKKKTKRDELVAANNLRINSIIPFIPGYSEAVKELNAKATMIPPSGAIAGIYSSVDQYQGVWKAPANVSIASLSGVSDFITNQDQETMNVDSNAGKSINAIRPFSGKGILVWGARTLDGNSNEWRYIPVRRLFNYIEESVQKSTSWAVFSPNDGNTWIKVKSQIENFLNNLWRAGALAGATPDSAYFVKVGLNLTMTSEDIQEGLLIVEVGLAAVRPAEFIVLRFSHKVQE